MKKLDIPTLKPHLITLSVAMERFAKAEAQLAKAEESYTTKIAILSSQIADLRTEMREDGNVIQAKDTYEEYEDLYNQAKVAATDAVLSTDPASLDGSKQFQQDQLEVRLRTTLTPRVTDIPAFATHIDQVGAWHIVKSITLNRKSALGLDEAIQGVKGMEVEKRTSVSFKEA